MTATVAHPEPLQAAQGHLRVVIKLPGRYMTEGDPVDDGETDDDDALLEWPIHDVSYMPDYPTRSLHSVKYPLHWMPQIRRRQVTSPPSSLVVWSAHEPSQPLVVC